MISGKVSLYIPCYNAERYIARAIEGALRQTNALDEILVVDDGSKDGTREIASRYPVRIISHDRNRGLAAARNTGFRNARNELVASLDADCVARAGLVGKAAAAPGRLEGGAAPAVGWKRPC